MGVRRVIKLLSVLLLLWDMRQRRPKDIFSKQDVDVEDMLMSMVTGIGLNVESEIVAMGGRKESELNAAPSLEGYGIVPSHEVSGRDMLKMVFEQFREYLW